MGNMCKAVLTLLGFKEVDGKWLITIDEIDYEPIMLQGYLYEEVGIIESYDAEYGEAMTLGEFISRFFD